MVFILNLTFKGTDIKASDKVQNNSHGTICLIHKSDLEYIQELRSTKLPYQELLSTIKRALINSSKLYKGASNSPKAGAHIITSYSFLYCNRVHLFSSFDISRKHFRETEAFTQQLAPPLF